MVEFTTGLEVRPLIEADLAAYQRLLADPRMAAANAAPGSLAPDLLAYWFEKDRHGPFAHAVIDRQHDRFVGGILYYAHAAPAQHYDVGYFLDPLLWGRGLMPAALRASLRLVRQALTGPVTIWADCLTTNQRSQRVLTKLGFQPTAAPAHSPLLPTAADVVWFRLDLPADATAI